MSGERALSKMQIGVEGTGTPGTAVAADTILLGEHQPIKPDRKPVMIQDNIGVRSQFNRSRIDQYAVSDTLRFPHAYYQLLPLLFSLSLKGQVTPTEQSSGVGDYLWTHTPSLTAGNTLNSATLELGDDTQAYEAEYLQIERLRISSAINQGMDASPVSIEADYYARQWTPTTFTGALSLPSHAEINGKLAQYYRYSAWSAVGDSTEASSGMRGFDLQLMPGAHPKFFGSTTKTFTTHGQGFIDATLALSLEGDATADAIYDLMQAKTYSVVRLEILGPQIGAGEVHSLKVDIGGVWQDVIPLGENDRGNNVHTAILQSEYDMDGGGAKQIQVVVSTNVTAI